MAAKMAAESVKAGLIGCGGMARHHLRRILKRPGETEFVVVSEPSEAAYRVASELFSEAGLEPPPNEPDLERLLADYRDRLDAVFIVTPHALHFGQARACLEAGVDVLLEKPMVMTADEARDLIEVRDRTGSLLVVSFNGSLSPNIRTAVAMLRAGKLGEVLNIHATVWQDWKQKTTGTWRQVPEVSGGGFLFDTGAHMLNTITDLVGEDFAGVAAWLDHRGTDVDILGTVMARTESGVLVTMNGCGEAINSCHSDVRIFGTKAIMRTDIWGAFLELQNDGEDVLTPVETPPSQGQWQQFLRVRSGELANPCPPEVGLRMARLWDAIRASAARDGQPVRVGDAATISD